MLKNDESHQSLNKERITFTKNTFPLQQVKKMIGKKLIVPMPNLIVTIQDKNNAKILRSKIMDSAQEKTASTKQRNLVLTTMYNVGILYVFKHIDVYLAISSISYKDMNAIGDTTLVVVQQYPKLTKHELKKIMG